MLLSPILSNVQSMIVGNKAAGLMPTGGRAHCEKVAGYCCVAGNYPYSLVFTSSL